MYRLFYPIHKIHRFSGKMSCSHITRVQHWNTYYSNNTEIWSEMDTQQHAKGVISSVGWIEVVHLCNCNLYHLRILMASKLTCIYSSFRQKSHAYWTFRFLPLDSFHFSYHCINTYYFLLTIRLCTSSPFRAFIHRSTVIDSMIIVFYQPSMFLIKSPFIRVHACLRLNVLVGYDIYTWSPTRWLKENSQTSSWVIIEMPIVLLIWEMICASLSLGSERAFYSSFTTSQVVCISHCWR